MREDKILKSDDSSIVDMFLNREEEAIRIVSAKYGARIRSIAYGITENTETAEECENDTYMEAWNRIPPHEPRTYLLAFLSRIVRTISINRCVRDRRLKRFAFISELTSEMEQCIASSISVENKIDENLLIEEIGKFLKEQPPKKRLVFMRRYYYLDKMETIAKRLDMKESTVRTLLTRMRKDLHQYLERRELL